MIWVIGLVFLVSLVFAFEISNNVYFIRGMMEEKFVGEGVGFCERSIRPFVNLSADTDGDGIPNLQDKCPMTHSEYGPKTLLANNYPGVDCLFEEEDKKVSYSGTGDGDGFWIKEDHTYVGGVRLKLVKKDYCPNKAETWNGYKDDDGCPDNPADVAPLVCFKDLDFGCKEKDGYRICASSPIAVSVKDEKLIDLTVKDDGTKEIKACAANGVGCDNYLDISAFDADFSKDACSRRGHWLPGLNLCCGDDYMSELGDVLWVVPATGESYQTLCTLTGLELRPRKELDGWWWAGAGAERYYIYTVDQRNNPFIGSRYDLVANGKKWAACDATNSVKKEEFYGTKIKLVPENGTFELYQLESERLILEDGRVPCPEPRGMSWDTAQKPPHEWKESDTYDPENKKTPFYCRQESYVPGDKPGEGNFASCECFKHDGTRMTDCSNIPQMTFCDTNVPGEDDTEEQAAYVPKNNCSNEAIKRGECIKGGDVRGDIGRACADQAGDLQARICEHGWICSAGEVYLAANLGKGQTCCIGKNAECKKIPSDASCTELRGCIFDPGKEICPKNNYVIVGGKGCCLSPEGVELKETMIMKFFQKDVHKSYICHQQNGIDIFAECCSDKKCKNTYDYYKDRKTFGEGGMLHALSTFDSYIRKKGESKWMDYVLKVRQSGSYIGTADVGNFVDLSNWSNYRKGTLEFDVVYSNSLSHIELEHSGNKRLQIGTIKQYSVNGDDNFRWHHIMIPLEHIEAGLKSQGKDFDNTPINHVRLYLKGQTTHLAIDNFFLRPGSGDKDTPTHYCAGDVGRWVDSLNPPRDATGGFSIGGDPSKGEIEDVDDDNKITSVDLWPWRNACRSQLSFGWTGTQCCGYTNNCGEDKICDWPSGGDDTYDFYLDSEAGCWAGYIVKEGESVSNVTGRTTYYPNVLLKNVGTELKFLGCETDGASLMKNPTLAKSKKLDATKSFEKRGHCKVEGTYFCSNDKFNSWLNTFIVVDEGGENDYTLADWETDEMKMKDAPEDKDIFEIEREKSCCPPDTCWDGNVCIKGVNGEKELHYEYFTDWHYGYAGQAFAFTQVFDHKGETDNYVCHLKDDGNASWMQLYRKETWHYPVEGSSTALTNDSNTCWTGQEMVPNGWYTHATNYPDYGDRFCFNGEWTTRTKYIAEALMNYSSGDVSAGSKDDNGQFTNYDLYCDSYDKVLSNYGRDDLESTLSEGETNNFCVIQYITDTGDIKTIFGVGLNNEISYYEDRFLPALENPGCAAAKTHEPADKVFGEFRPCTGEKLWYNNKLDMILFSQGKDTIDSPTHNIFREFFANPFKTLFNIITNAIVGQKKQDFDFITKPKDYDKIYVSRKYGFKQSKEVRGIIENTTDHSGDESRYIAVMSVQYNGFLVDDVCEGISDVYGVVEQDIPCWGQGRNVLVTTKNPSVIYPYWHDLTTETRAKVLRPAGFIIRDAAEFDGWGNLRLKGSLTEGGNQKIMLDSGEEALECGSTTEDDFIIQTVTKAVSPEEIAAAEEEVALATKKLEDAIAAESLAADNMKEKRAALEEAKAEGDAGAIEKAEEEYSISRQTWYDAEKARNLAVIELGDPKVKLRMLSETPDILSSVAVINLETGNMCITGDYDPATSPSADHMFVVYGWSGTDYNKVVASIDTAGDLHLEGNLNENVRSLR